MSIPSPDPAGKGNRDVAIGGPGKTFTARECSCYEASPGRFVVQLTVRHARAAAEVDFYDLAVLPAPAWGRAAFRLVKACNKAERPTYTVLLHDGGRGECDCPHATYRPGGEPCRHVLAVQALVASGKLPLPAAAPRPAPAPAPKPAADGYCTCDDCGQPAADCACKLALAPAGARWDDL